MPPKTRKPKEVAKVSDDEKSIGYSETEDIEPTAYEIHYKVQSSESKTLSELIKLLSNANLINQPNDPTTNIIDRFYNKCYNIPSQKIVPFFKMIEACRRNKERIMFAEKQLEHSGIMIDFDILQDTEEPQITGDIIKTLCSRIVGLLLKLIKFPERKMSIIVGVTKKPKILYREDKNAWKDGLHILIPGIKVTRSIKSLIINKLIESEIVDQAFEDVHPATIQEKGQNLKKSDFLDQHSTSVPVHFIGCPSKKGAVPYNLSHILEFKVDTESSDILVVNTKNNLVEDPSFNLMHEFSVNFEVPNGFIQKRVYDVKDTFINDIAELTNKTQKQDGELIRNYGELSMYAVHDVAMQEIKELLDILDPVRAEKYDPWFKVLCLLANISLSYKPLAEYFSRKSSSFRLVDFETKWTSITKGGKKGKLHIGTLHWWAQQDNPEKYQQLRSSHIGNIVWQMIMEPYREGHLSHADVALVLYKALKHKYITDIPEGEYDRVWYEFVLDNDDYVEGEIYKWRRSKLPPKSLSIYISQTLPTLLKRSLEKLKEHLDRSTGNTHVFLKTIYKNLKATMRNLGNKGFKKSVMSEGEELFHQYGFYDNLDKDPLIRGVENGILKLSIMPGGRPRLIQGYHVHKVSKYTKVPYIPFNPNDPLTKRIIVSLRNLFPDEEPDSFDFTMNYFASTIDGNPKESMFMIMRGGGGNGKTFITELHKSTIGSIYGVKMPLSYLTNKNSNAEGATPAQMQLKDASLATYSESNRMEVLNAARVKEVTGLETLAGRKLHKDMINFKPKCHHLVTTNFDFVIECNDHGTWRRIVYNPLKITFVSEKDYNPQDPYNRVRDDTVTDKWTEDPEVLGRYLGYMVWVHYWLYQKYGGKVSAVPHPHIVMETDKYRCRQDTISLFLSQRCVKTVEEKSEVLLVDEMQKYISWYNTNHGGVPMTAKIVLDQLLNSKIGKNIRNTTKGYTLVGLRFLMHNMEPDVGEEYAFKGIFDRVAPADNFGIKLENAEQYHARLCQEYEVYKHLFDNSETFDNVADVDGNEYVIVNNIPPRLTEEKLREHTQRADNVEYEYVPLPEPSKSMFTNDYNFGEIKDMLPDYGDIVENADLSDDLDVFEQI